LTRQAVWKTGGMPGCTVTRATALPTASERSIRHITEPVREGRRPRADPKGYP
jgi:hypothetical protein